MANNYTVNTITATGQGSSSLDSGDFPSTGAGGGYPFLTITPDAGYVISAENFTIGGSTPSSTTASPYTATFTNGSGGCSLPAPHITSIRFSNSTTAGTVGNVVFCELTGLGGTFGATTPTALTIDIDGSAECAPVSYSFYDGNFADDYQQSYQPNQGPSSWTEIYPGITTTSPLALSTNTNNTTIGAVTTMGTNPPYEVNQVSAECCSSTNNVTYTRHFYADPGYYFVGFPTWNVYFSNNPSSYSVSFTGITQPTAPGVPNWNNTNFWTHIKAEVSYNCQSTPLSISAGEMLIWRRGPIHAIPPPPPPPEVNKCQTYPVQQVFAQNSFCAVEFQATPGTQFEIVAEHLDSGDTFDWTTNTYTTTPTSYDTGIIPNTGFIYLTLETPSSVGTGYNFLEITAVLPSGVVCNGCDCKWLAIVPSASQFQISGSANNFSSLGHATLGTTYKNSVANPWSLSWSDTLTAATAPAKLLSPEAQPKTTISGNITCSEVLESQAGTTASTIYVTNNVGVSLGAAVSGSGVTAGRQVTSFIGSTGIVLSGTHAIGAGVDVTFSNKIVSMRQPQHNDWLNNKTYEVKVIANLNSPSVPTATYLVEMLDQDIIDLGAQSASATYQNMVFSRSMPGGVIWKSDIGTKLIAQGNNVAQIELTSLAEAVGSSVPKDIPVGETIVMTTNGGGELKFDNFGTIATTGTIGTSIPFSCDVTTIESHHHANASAGHKDVVYALSPGNFLRPYRYPKIANFGLYSVRGRTTIIEPLTYMNDSVLPSETVVLGDISAAVINVTGTTSGTSTVVGQQIHFVTPQVKGAGPGASVITFTVTDSFGLTGPSCSIIVSLTQ